MYGSLIVSYNGHTGPIMDIQVLFAFEVWPFSTSTAVWFTGPPCLWRLPRWYFLWPSAVSSTSTNPKPEAVTPILKVHHDDEGDVFLGHGLYEKSGQCWDAMKEALNLQELWRQTRLAKYQRVSVLITTIYTPLKDKDKMGQHGIKLLLALLYVRLV